MLAMLVTIVHTWFLLLLLSVNYNLNYNRVLHFSKATTFKSCLKVTRGFLSEPQSLNQTFKIMTFKWRQRKLNQRATIVKSAAVQSWISGFKLAGQVPLLYCIVYIFNFMSFAKNPRSKNCQFFLSYFIFTTTRTYSWSSPPSSLTAGKYKLLYTAGFSWWSLVPIKSLWSPTLDVDRMSWLARWAGSSGCSSSGDETGMLLLAAVR